MSFNIDIKKHQPSISRNLVQFLWGLMSCSQLVRKSSSIHWGPSLIRVVLHSRPHQDGIWLVSWWLVDNFHIRMFVIPRTPKHMRALVPSLSFDIVESSTLVFFFLELRMGMRFQVLLKHDFLKMLPLFDQHLHQCHHIHAGVLHWSSSLI